MFTVGSLFSGIGGLDLGLERAGFKVVWQVENDEFCQKVLAKHWPNVTRFRDVRETGRDTLARVDVLAGGFPCQPHSYAGKRKAGEDTRNLWPEFYRIIRELEPQWVLAENVLGLLSSEDGTFFGGILRDLAQARYDAEWCVLRASDMGAPHKRERVFLVAHTGSLMVRTRPDFTGSLGETSANKDSEGISTLRDTPTRGSTSLAHTSECRLEKQQEAGWIYDQSNAPDTSGVGLADAYRTRLQEWNGREPTPWTLTTIDRRSTGQFESILGRNFDGFSRRLDQYRWPAGPGPQHNWEPPRVITGRQPNRAARLKALGNAVVPQLAEYIGHCILERMEA